MAARLTEDIVQALIRILKSNLPHEITVTNGQNDGDESIDPPKNASYHVAQVAGLSLPMVVIDPLEVTFSPASAEQFVNGDLSIQVIVVSENVEYERGTRQCWRYGVSVYRAIHDQGVISLDGLLHGRCIVTGIKYQDWRVGTNTNVYRRAAVVQCNVRFHEPF